MKRLQVAALSRINFVFYDLKKNPPVNFVPDAPGDSIEEKLNNFLSTLSPRERNEFNKEMFHYLGRESLTESKFMLIINYLYALLFRDPRHNQISIYENFQDRIEEIEAFKRANRNTLNKIKTARNKFYAHIDLNWMQHAEGIQFEEIETCIQFLNGLFNYKFEPID